MSIRLIWVWDILKFYALGHAWLDRLFRPTNNCFRVPWGVFALTGFCFIKAQSLRPAEEIRALMKAPLSKRCVLFLKEISVLLLLDFAG